jgi:ureidoacrylate peracid hydrolase
VQAKDLIVDKTRFGAFVPGSSDLHEILGAREIDTLIITGTNQRVLRIDRTRRDADELQDHLRRGR